MKLTRHEILLAGGLALALTLGAVVKQFRVAHPAPLPPASPSPRKIPRAAKTPLPLREAAREG